MQALRMLANRNVVQMCSLISFKSPTLRFFGIFNNTCNSMLKPSLPIVQQVCGLKYKGRVKLRCKDCYKVMRDGVLYVMCKTYGRHKQSQLVKSPKDTYILTHATQGKLRQW